MTDPQAADAGQKRKDPTQPPGDSFVGPWVITVSLAHTIAFAFLVAYTLMSFLPRSAPSEADELLHKLRVAMRTDSLARIAAAGGAASTTAVPPRGGTGNLAPPVAGSAAAATASLRVAVVPVDSLWCAQPPAERTAARWTHPDTTAGYSCLTWLWLEGPIPFEWRLYGIAFFAGMLGATVHMLRSLGWYVGNRDLKWSWLGYLYVLPVVGALLGTAFYVVIRGGFFEYPEGKVYGYAAIALLVGMFTTPAALRLKEIAEAMLTRPGAGADSTPQGTGGEAAAAKGTLWIRVAERLERAKGAKEDALRLIGMGFTAQLTAEVNGKSHAARFVKDDTMELPLDANDLNTINVGGDFKIVLKRPDGRVSNTLDYT